jgi:methyl-accepting chemotaxis protein/methyl-accepting chemotaxis protein-1 (serine sensor receptor)
MEKVTQTTAATAEESAAAAEELNAQAETMRDVVSRLQVMVDGAAAPASGLRSTPVRSRAQTRRPPLARVRTQQVSSMAESKRQATERSKEFPMEESFSLSE